MHKIVEVQALADYKVSITFSDGTSGIVDLSHLVGSGVFESWKNYEFFREVRIGEFGELVWSDEIDLCPDALYIKATGKKPEDVFPALKHEEVHT